MISAHAYASALKRPNDYFGHDQDWMVSTFKNFSGKRTCQPM